MNTSHQTFEQFFEDINSYTKEFLYRLITKDLKLTFEEDSISLILPLPLVQSLGHFMEKTNPLLKVIKKNGFEYYGPILDYINDEMVGEKSDTNVNIKGLTFNNKMSLRTSVDDDKEIKEKNLVGTTLPYNDIPSSIKEGIDFEAINKDVRRILDIIKDLNKYLYEPITKVFGKTN